MCLGLGSVTACRAVGAERRKRPPTDIQSGVDLVSLDVCVRDPSGGFMADLAADDFVVLENGKPQRILFSTVRRGTILDERPDGLHRFAPAADDTPA
jgi:hypothetical protein